MEVITTDAMRTVADAAGWDAGLQYDVYQKEEKTSAGKGYLFIKRTFDIAASVAAGILLLLPMLLIAVLVRIDSHGPALFRQERLGKGGKPFTIIKFRTMYENAEANGPQWAVTNDVRCTKFGRFLRHTHLDELPQIWNIIKGDMSIVGPRPERAYFYNKFELFVPGFCDRLEVRPGLTGLAQINGGYELGPEEKIIYDMEYIHNRSVKMDVYCILKTVGVVLKREGVK